MKTLLRLAVAAALFATGPAWALYYCKCDTGAQSGCTAGSDANDGSTPTLAKVTPPDATAINAAAAGAQYHFCQGGLWDTFAGFGTIVNPNATQASPIVFDSYAAAWGGGGVRPWFKMTGAPFIFGYFGDTTNDGGYVVRGLHLDGLSCANNIAAGIYSSSKGVHDLTIDNVLVEHFRIGIGLEQTPSLRNTRVAIKNSTINRSWGTAGIFGDADDLLIENNTLTKNGGDDNPATCGAGTGFEHGIYLSGDGKNAQVRYNSISGSGNGGNDGTTCSSGGITMHGTWDSANIEGNTVDGGTVQTSSCGGIDVNAGYDSYEAFQHFRISGNTIINSRITISNSPSVIVENNRLVKTLLDAGIFAIEVPRDAGNGSGATDEPITNVTIRNNNIHFGPGLTGATGIKLDTVSGGTTGKISGNIITFGSGGSSNKCISYGPIANYTYTGTNICNGFNVWATSNGSTYTTLANAQAAGFDTGSLNSDPLYVTTPSTSNTSFQIQSSSPAKDAGNATYCTRLDAIGWSRSTCDIGAREYGNGN